VNGLGRLKELLVLPFWCGGWWCGLRGLDGGCGRLKGGGEDAGCASGRVKLDTTRERTGDEWPFAVPLYGEPYAASDR